MKTAPLLAVENLACARGGMPVLEGLSFTLLPGRALILRGPNGAGKTTLLRTLAGLQPPLGGRIVASAEAIAYGGHDDGVKAALTVAENLWFWARLFGTRGIGPALAAYGLEPLARRPAHTLSAGQKRRLGLARLLVTGRPLWLLDEPTVSLDAGAFARFGAALGDHLAAGGGAVIASHIALGIEAEALDIAPLRARPRDAAHDGFGKAFA